MNSPTPLPWHVADRGIGYEIHTGSPAPDKGCWSADPTCREVNMGQKETFSRADAELIVRAVNAYQPMLEALELSAKALLYACCNAEVHDAADAVVAAIRLAKGEGE